MFATVQMWCKCASLNLVFTEEPCLYSVIATVMTVNFCDNVGNDAEQDNSESSDTDMVIHSQLIITFEIITLLSRQ